MVSMNCRRAQHLLFDFFDGLSNETLRAEVERHLGECADCERFAAEMTRCLALLKRAPVEPLDENFNWKVRLAIHRERNAALSRAHTASAWVRGWNVRYAISSGLAFGAVLVVGAVLLRTGNVPAPVQLAEPSVQMTPDIAAKNPPPVSHSPMTPLGSNGMRAVSTGVSDEGPTMAPQGAIDETKTEARIDSLINSDVMRMSAAERNLYIQRRIEKLRLHLQSQQSSPARP
jgi:anti-sigma factor RsiW